MSEITFVLPGGTSGSSKPKKQTKQEPIVDPSSIKLSLPKKEQSKPTPGEYVQNKLNERRMSDDAFLRGLTFGLSDRAIAFGKDLFDEGDNYEKYLKERFDERDAYKDEHPFASAGNEIVGGLAVGGPLAGVTKKAVASAVPALARVAASKGLIPGLTRGAGVLAGGAGAGAVGGAGQADLGEVSEGVREGATTGALTAGALKTAGLGVDAVNYVAGPFVKRAATALGLTDPEKWAKEEWLDAMGLDGDDLGKIAARLKDAERVGDRGAMAMDVAGINAKSKLKSATLPSTTAKAELDEKLANRSLGQVDRVTEDLRKSVNPRLDTANAADEIYRQAREKADPLYQAARDIGPIDDPKVIGWFNATKNRQQIMRDYAKAMEDNGTPMDFKFTIKEDGSFAKVKAPTVEDLMRIKDHYGQLRKRLVDPVTGQVDNKATVKINGNEYGYDVINKEYKDLRELVRSVTPDGKGGSLLAEADKISGDAAEVGKALNLGRKIRSLSSEDLKRQFGALESEAEKEAFRIGAAGQLFSTLEKGKGGANAIQQLYGSKAMKEKMELVFPDDVAREYFAKAMEVEAKLAEGARQMGPRVSAASGIEPAADPSLGGVAVNAAQGRIGAAISNLGRFFSNQWEASMPQYADPLLRLGMMGGDETERLAREIAAKNSGALSKVGRLLGRAGRSVVRGAPYATANVAGQNVEGYPNFMEFE